MAVRLQLQAGRVWGADRNPEWVLAGDRGRTGRLAAPGAVEQLLPDGDPRLAATVIMEGDTIYKGTQAEEVADNAISPTKMQNRKYLLEYTDPPPALSNAPANWRFIRYADLLLWHAEAANELGETAKALESLNNIRTRVSMPEVTETDKAALRQAIYHERRVELGLEGHRYFDIIRTDRGAELLGDNGFIAGKHEYFPIPQSQIDICSTIEQNPYYDR